MSSNSIPVPSSTVQESNRAPVNGAISKRFIGALGRFYDRLPSFKRDASNPSSLLDAVGQDPQRMKPITDTAAVIYGKSIDCFSAMQDEMTRFTQIAYRRFTGMSHSLVHIFGVDTLIHKLLRVDASSMVNNVSPYLLAYYIDHVYRQIVVEEGTTADSIKLAACVCFLGYAMTHRITEPLHHQQALKVMLYRTASLLSIVNLHIAGYKSGYAAADRYLSPMQSDNLITEETEDSLSLISGIITTSVLIPEAILKYNQIFNKFKLKMESRAGVGTQSSKLSSISNGLTFEVNMFLQVYDHCTKQLSDPSRLFQYFIVALNVLKDVEIHDESLPPSDLSVEKAGWGPIIKKTRNIWLLAADSIIKARIDLTNRLDDIAHDSALNQKVYTIVRKGRELQNIYQCELIVGDLVRLEDAMSTFNDVLAGTIRMKATLSGYLVQLKGPSISKKVAISLMELNGESKPIIFDPPRKAKARSDCIPLDLLNVAASSAIFPGTEFLSFDNGNPTARAEGLFLQIAATHDVKQTRDEKIPFSARQISNLKTKLIHGVLGLSGMSALALMKHPISSFDAGSTMQFYGAEFVDKFTQVFVEAQTLIPLTSDVLLEMTNRTLCEDLNRKVKNKIPVNNALCVADLFQFLHEKKVRIYSDKTGTVTETFMMMRNIIYSSSPQAEEKVLIAFATTFSDQKTEAEENEIRRYYLAEKRVDIKSIAVPGGVDHLKKTLTREGSDVIEFNTRRLGLFLDFGGQFTMREQEGKAPVVVFCGAPKAEESGQRRFRDTPLHRAFQNYEQLQQTADPLARQDSLTRDWCIAEAELTPRVYADFMEALNIRDPSESKRAMQESIRRIKDNFECLGIFQIDNPIKPRAREAIQEWNRAGIGFMMLTGDTHQAARMIAAKLYPGRNQNIYDLNELQLQDQWEQLDLSNSTVIITNTKVETLAVLDRIEALGSKKPNIIFCQMKDIDKKNLVVHAKKQGYFIIANGDGCNDLLMLKAAHVAIGDAARDGSFARGVEEVSTFTDIQLRQLMNGAESSLYQLLDIQAGKESQFLQHFAPLANTQPKIITSLLGKALKSVAIPRALGWSTNEISGQFGKLIAYDTVFVTGVYQASITTADTPLMDRPVNTSKLPYITLGTAVAIALIQIGYSFNFQNKQVTTEPTLLFNLAFSIGCLFIFLAPPGYSQKPVKVRKKVESLSLTG